MQNQLIAKGFSNFERTISKNCPYFKCPSVLQTKIQLFFLRETDFVFPGNLMLYEFCLYYSISKNCTIKLLRERRSVHTNRLRQAGVSGWCPKTSSKTDTHHLKSARARSNASACARAFELTKVLTMALDGIYVQQQGSPCISSFPRDQIPFISFQQQAHLSGRLPLFLDTVRISIMQPSLQME